MVKEQDLRGKKQVIVVGGGFAGLQLVRNLDKRLFNVLLIDKINHHQFQPLFYQVATSQIEPASISFPFRNIFKSRSHIQIRMTEMLQVNPEEQTITTTIGDFPYDYLVLATGCRTNYFGNANIKKNAFSLKTTYQSITIRNHILTTFEKVIAAPREDRERMLNLTIVGAGPTGVELAGAFSEIKKEILPKDYHDIDLSKFTIRLVEGSNHVLNNMSKASGQTAEKYLKKMGVVLLKNTFVKDYDGENLTLSSGETIKSATVIWAAGVTGRETRGIPAESIARGNRIIVNRQNKIRGFDNIFAVGDIAYMETPDYPNGHPQVANVAINQAKLLARNLKQSEQGKPVTDYKYKDLGSMATIGRNKAVVDLPFIRFKGYFAWLVWMFLHLMLILSVRNRLIIFINWAWLYVTKNTSLRLILTSGKNI
ncbi:NAD(P)/FAD-dependent oxidoreductase [Marinilabilia salmonicolor]|jgi:NADH dehydrogenase|uniref:NADH:ubiquinone reductase (non-electrogenic) n=1 Tax=Marinilabilia salmonicolor TaxID=989 RepID=A0A368V515_9BACT|nr:NAD(P)/FAD-dependent oxidoreductase [Marinilabilia salmonicolor]RCW36196.1 NADH dehydrogenase [Marinilabilia salmonicolor]